MTSFGLIVLCSIIASTASSGSASWGYGTTKHGAFGPRDWGKVNAICDNEHQSPINIITRNVHEDDNLQPLVLSYSSYAGKVFGKLANNGHAPTFTLEQGLGQVTLQNGEYTLAQFHFHFGCGNGRGSEHTVNGRAYPGELHMVFYKTAYGSLGAAASKLDGLTVVGTFLETGYSSFRGSMSYLSRKMSLIKKQKTTTHVFYVWLESLVSGLSRGTLAYYNYKGSLTTPNCYESVNWIVLKGPIGISNRDLSYFRGLEAEHGYDHGRMCNNYRPTQPLNGRTVSKFEPDDDK